MLKPGGTFACLEFSTPPNAVWRFLYHIYLKVMIPFWGQVFTHDRPSFVYLADSIRCVPRPGTLRPNAARCRIQRCELEELRRRHRGCAYGTQIIRTWTWPEGHALPLWSNPVRDKGISGAFCSCGIYRNRTPSDQGEAKVDLREKPAQLSGLCFWWACSTYVILHLQHRKARRWKRGQHLHRPSCRQIVRASASPRRCRPGAPHGSTYCERAPCLERSSSGPSTITTRTPSLSAILNWLFKLLPW